MVRFTTKRRKPIGVAAGDMPPVGPLSEYRNREDDAWYSVYLALRDETLVVKYREFPNEQDELFHAVDFDTPHKISELRMRFRAISEQLEANGSDCKRVGVGSTVCAINDYGLDARHFYDALVDAVAKEDHTIMDGALECSCSFVVTWLHGPLAGKQTIARTEDLCLIKSHEELDPRVTCFLEIVKWKHGIVLLSPCSALLNEDIVCNTTSPAPSSKQKAPFPTRTLKDGIQAGSAFFPDEGHVGCEREEDVDLGGQGSARAYVRHCDSERSFMVDDLVEDVSHMGLEGRYQTGTKAALEEARHFILVENLEKDISPAVVTNFFRKSACVEVEAFLFLSLSSDPYLRAALVVESAEELERLCDFVVKPAQMIISSRGRPWIVSDSAGPELVRSSFWCLEQDVENEKEHPAGDLKVVQSGSEEYSKALKVRDLFMEFAEHQKSLVKRLLLEEQSILDS